MPKSIMSFEEFKSSSVRSFSRNKVHPQSPYDPKTMKTYSAQSHDNNMKSGGTKSASRKVDRTRTFIDSEDNDSDVDIGVTKSSVANDEPSPPKSSHKKQKHTASKSPCTINSNQTQPKSTFHSQAKETLAAAQNQSKSPFSKLPFNNSQNEDISAAAKSLCHDSQLKSPVNSNTNSPLTPGLLNMQKM
eukprot:TCONS_00041241-protein